jgi:hypothetical protein
MAGRPTGERIGIYLGKRSPAAGLADGQLAAAQYFVNDDPGLRAVRKRSKGRAWLPSFSSNIYMFQ